MTTNRSGEELAMRDHVEAWGRARWPDARIVHELVVGQCRIDMAFIRPNDLIGVEIKSSRDVLDRLEKQMTEFRTYLPEVWLAVAPKWEEKTPYTGRIVVGPEGVSNARFSFYNRRDELVLPHLLDLLWADEIRAVAERMRLLSAKRQPKSALLPVLARAMTGDQILTEVCRELRARGQGKWGKAFWRSDAPIPPTESAA